MLISNAYAQAASGSAVGPAGFSLTSVAPIAIMIVVFYFLLIRPQQKRAKDQKSMMDALKSGDEVITSGGILAKVSKISDSGQYVTVEISDAGVNTVEIVVQKAAIQTLLPKGTIKSV